MPIDLPDARMLAGHAASTTWTEQPDVLFEPGGLAVGLGWLRVADTTHHEVTAIELTTGAARALSLSPF